MDADRQAQASLEYLRLTCLVRIKQSVLGIAGHSEAAADLETEISTLRRRLGGIEFEFKAKGWPLPDYQAWQRSGVWP